MRTRLRAWLTAALTTAALAGATAGAQASPEIYFDPAGEISAVSNGKLTFTSELGRVACNATLTGRLLAEALELVVGTSYGSVTGARFANCEGDSVTILSVPWRLEFAETTGSYPEALTGLGLEVAGMQLQLLVGGVFRCLYAGDMPLQWALSSEEEDTWDGGTLTPSGTLPLFAGSPCGRSASVAGTFAVAPPQKVRRRAARLGYSIAPIPVGLEETVLVLHNVALTPAFAATITELKLVGLPEDEEFPEKFRIPALTDNCTGYVLNPARTRSCTADVVYAGLVTERPMHARVRIEWHDGLRARQTHAWVRAN
jgi:hypothetical protein